MATSSSFQSSTNDSQSTSTSTPTVTQTPQSQWSLQLSSLLAQLGQTEQAWAMQEYARAGQVTDAQINNYIAQAQQGNQMATNLMGRYQDLYGPMEDQYARNAGSYDSLGRIQNEMGAAESRAMQAGNQASDNAERELQAFGIDPSSGRYQDLIRASRTADAASAASAGETARRAVEAEGSRRRENAIAMGQQLPAASVNAMNSAYQGIAGAENAALGLINSGANLTTASSKFFDPATRLTNPLQGQNQQSQSTGTGRSLGGSNSNSPQGGGGGGGSRTSDPFNSDRFGRGSPSPGSSSGGSGRGVPEHQIPNQTFRPNPYATIRPVDSVGQGGGGNPWEPGLENMGGQGGTYPDPWNDVSNPYEWGQGGSGILPDADNIELGGGPNNPWGQTPDAPPGWYDNTTDGSAGQGWYGGTPEANWPEPAQQNFDTNYGDGGGDPWANQGGDVWNQYNDYGNSGGWDQSTQGYSGGQDDYSGYQDYGGSSGFDDYYAKGGEVKGRPQQRQQGGGYVPPQMSPSRGRVTDDIPAVIPQSGGQARINAGEFVLPRDVVEWKGKEFFDKMIKQARQRRTGMPQRG